MAVLLAAVFLVPASNAATFRVVGGTLSGNAHVNGTNLTIEAAATLSGTGTVHGAAVVRGAVSPGTGTSAETITFTGPLTFEGGRFECDAAASDSVDALAVSGRVSGTATVVVARVAGALPSDRVIIAGAADSAYGSFSVSPSVGLALGQSGALDLTLSAVPEFGMIGTNGAAIASGAPYQMANGSRFASVVPGASQTNVLRITNSGIATLTIASHATNGAGSAAFSISGVPASVAAGAASEITVVYAPFAAGTHTATVAFACNSPATPFLLNLAGSCFAASTNVGPFAGGNAVTFTNGHFGTITNVLVGGVAATIQDSGDNWFTIAMPSIGATGAVDVVVQTSDNGDTTLAGGYTYHAPGRIGGMVVGGYAWTNLSQGFNDRVRAVHKTSGGTLLAGGYFTDADGVAINRIAQWDGENWTNMGGGFSDYVWMIEESPDGTLYAGGNFNLASSANVYKLAKWNGANWTNAGGGFNSAVYSMGFDANSNAYVGGGFTQAYPSHNVGRVARWNGSNWTNIFLQDGTNSYGFNNGVYAIATDTNGMVYFAGTFTNATTPSGDVPVRCVAKFDGTNVTQMGDGFGNGVYALEFDNEGTLYAGGSFFEWTNGYYMSRIAKWNGNAWTNVGDGLLNGTIQSMAFDEDNDLYVGGQFSQLWDSTPALNMAVWNGLNWTNMGSGANNAVHDLAYLSNKTVLAGGQFTSGGDVATNRVGLVNPEYVFDPGTHPSSGSWTGGYPVAIVAESAIGNGSDITSVSVCGVAATINSQMTDRVWITVGPTVAPGTGDIVVVSTSYGTTVGTNSFEYLRETQAALAFAPSSPQAYGTTNALAVSGGSGTGAVSYAVSSGPGLIVGGTNLAATAGSGSIVVVATKAQDDLYYVASTTATVAAAKADQAIGSFQPTNASAFVTTDAVGLSAAATSGLGVTFAVGSGPGSIAGGTNLTFTGAGSVSIVASQAGDANWNAAAPLTNTFTVTKASATVYLQNLAQTYDGTARTATATTMPAGLTVSITYDGTTNAPTGAGTYSATGTVDDVMYQGSATGLLVVAKANQTIAFPAISDVFWTNAAGASATASSGLGVSFAVASGPATLSGGTNLSFSGYGTVSIAASQGGNANWNPAPGVTNSFEALGPVLRVLGTNGAVVASGNAPAAGDGTDFGEIVVGMGTLTNTFTITNSGTAALTFSGLTTNGPQAGSFAVASLPATIPAGGSYNALFKYAPAAGGPNAASFEFAFNGTNSPYAVNVSGMGLGGGIELDTNVLAFAATFGGTNPAAQTVAMTNVGVSGFTYTNVVTYGDGASGWLSVLPNNGTVALGGALAFTNFVDATGINAGTYYATSTVTAADATNSPQSYVATLVVARAAQGIDFPNPGAQLTTNAPGLSATSTSGLAVAFAVLSGPATLSGGTNLAFSGAGTVEIVASQAGNSNWLAAASVTQSFAVAKTPQAALAFAPATPQTFGTTNVLATTGGSGTGAVSYAATAGMGAIIGTNGLHATTGTGSVTVVATKAADAMYLSIAATATVSYAKANQSITFPAIADQLATNAVGLSATASSALGVSFAVAGGPASIAGGTNLTFSTSGTVSVVASQAGDARYAAAPSRTNAFNVSKAAAPVYLLDLAQVYDGTARTASATTLPAGLAVEFTYDGLVSAPTNAGTYAVTGTVNEARYQGSAAGTLAVARAQDAIVFSNTNQTYDGTGKAAAATADSGSPVALTYDGSTNPPVNAGTYSVTGIVDSANWEATNVATLVVARAAQGIDFPNPGAQLTTNAPVLAATSTSGLAVAFAVLSGPATLSGGTNLTFSGAGTVEIVASQAGNSNWLAAASVTQSFAVAKTPQAALAFAPATPQTFGTTNVLATTGGSGTGAVSYAACAGMGAIIGTNGLHATTGTGSVTVVATKAADDMYLSIASTATVSYAKAAATVHLLDLAQVYDGTARTISATSLPAGLAVEFTYDGLVSAPTNAGTYAVTGTVNDADYQGSAAGTLAVARAQDSIAFTNLFPTYDGTGKAATATAGSGSAVSLTYDGSAALPVNAGTYAVTGVVDAANWQATNSATLTIAKADQAITNFLPADGAAFVLNSATTVSAQAESGLAVGFTNLAPEIAELSGFAISFTNPGLARVRAFQAGNSNWNAAAPVVNEWRVGGLITNVAPGVANVGGGIEVVIQGLWLGNGSDITNVTLAGTEALIVTQAEHSVTVVAGMAPATATGDVFVASGTGGPMALSNAFEYLWLAAPEQLDPVAVTPTNLFARWLNAAGAQTHEMDVATDTNFASMVAGYDGLDVGQAEQYPVEGLSPDTWYAIRFYARNANGYSWPSRTAWVPTTTNTPYEAHPALPGPVTEGARMEHELEQYFAGAGLVYAAWSSDTNVVAAWVDGGRLTIDPVGPGTATVTVTATDPATGYVATYEFEVTVAGSPWVEDLGFQQREGWNPRFTQTLRVRNDSGMEANGVRVLFSGLMPGIEVENQTGVSPDGRDMIEMRTAFAAGETLDLNVAYVCSGAYRVDEWPPAIEVQYVLPEWTPPLPGSGVAIEGIPLSGGRFLLQFASKPGNLYAIEYMNDFPAGEWVRVPLRLLATANQTQWIDSGPPATEPPSGLRAYRVKELAQ